MSINLFPNMKRFFSLLLAAVMMVSLLAANAHAANTNKITDYGDAYGHWAYEALTWAVDNGVLVGTPISNSMVKLYTMMRYLQFKMLAERGILHFDSWAASFDEKVTAVELKPEGTGFRAKTRFARFFNLPELMNLWKEAADIQTADMLKLPVPEAEYVTISTEPSEAQKEMVQSLAARAERVRRGEVEPTEDNMLKITSDGRKLALDQRIANPLLPDDPGSKVNACVDNVFNIWQESSETLSQRPRLSTMITVSLCMWHRKVYAQLQKNP